MIFRLLPEFSVLWTNNTNLCFIMSILHLGIIVLIPMNGFRFLYEFLSGHFSCPARIFAQRYTKIFTYASLRRFFWRIRKIWTATLFLKKNERGTGGRCEKRDGTRARMSERRERIRDAKPPMRRAEKSEKTTRTEQRKQYFRSSPMGPHRKYVR